MIPGGGGGSPVVSLELNKIYDDADTEHLNGYAYIPEPEAPTKEGCEFRFWSHYGSKFDFESPVTSDITLYGEWFDPIITVTFDSNGGTPVAPLELTKSYYSWDTEQLYGYVIIPEPEAPTKEGYEFKYWSQDVGKYQSEFTFYTQVQSDITLYAVWFDPTQKFTVTFDAQGGTPVEAQEVLVNTNVVEPEVPARDGYVFAYWSIYSYDDATPFNFEYDIITGNTTLYAHWYDSSITYTITFDSQGGTPVEEQKLFSGQCITEPEVPKKAGYQFLGWSTCADYLSYFWFGERIYSDRTLYAIWKKNTCTVTFNTDGGTSVATQEVMHGYSVEKPETPTKEGCEFKYWYKEGELGRAFDFSTPVYDDEITLCARWYDPTQPLMVVFESNGGTSVETQQVLYGENAVKPETPTKEGYEFLYWASDESLCYEYYFDSEDAKITNDIVLYACWYKTSYADSYESYYSVAFDENYEGSSCTYRTYYKGIHNTIKWSDIPTPVRAGYVFGGWYRTKNPVFNGNQPNLEGIAVYEDMNFYALWISDDTTYNIKIYDVFYDESDIFERRVLREDRDVRINEQYVYRALEIEGYRSEGFFAYYNVRDFKDTSYDFKYYKVDSRYPDIIRFFVDGRHYETHGLEEYTDELEMGGNRWVAVDPPEINPEKSGYIFKGWKSEGYFFEAKLVDGEMQSYVKDELIDFDNYYVEKTEGPYTVYAEWEEKNTCTVTFDTKGGTPVEPQEVEPNGKATEPAAPVKDGFAFEYWYRDTDGESVPFNFESTIITEDITLCALWTEVSRFTITVIDEYYDVDGTTLLSSETRSSEELLKDSSYSFEALSTIGYKVLGQSSYTGTVTEDLTVTFKYAEDVSVLGGTLVLSIPAEMELAYDASTGAYMKTDSVYASGRCGMKKRLDVQTPQHITFVNNDDDSVVIENAKVTFGSAVSDGSMQEQWSATELREGIGSPVGKSISVAVDKAAIDYLGSYNSLITYNVSLVENSND